MVTVAPHYKPEAYPPGIDETLPHLELISVPPTEESFWTRVRNLGQHTLKNGLINIGFDASVPVAQALAFSALFLAMEANHATWNRIDVITNRLGLGQFSLTGFSKSELDE